MINASLFARVRNNLCVVRPVAPLINAVLLTINVKPVLKALLPVAVPVAPQDKCVSLEAAVLNTKNIDKKKNQYEIHI